MLLTIAFVGSSLVQAAETTPNDFFNRGTPTFIVGTAGDDRADRAIRAQAALVRDLLFPTAKIIPDSDIDVAKGPAAWPPNPVLYGGPHVNQVLAGLGASLPFQLERGKLAIGGKEFEGDEHRLIAVVPARAPSRHGPGHPEFLLYAGSGSPGVAEINAVRHGGDAILIADAFGRLLTGTWRERPDGSHVAEFPDDGARRIFWRAIERQIKTSAAPGPIPVHIQFPRELARTSDRQQVIEACLRGLENAAAKLGTVTADDVSVYVHPDIGTIAFLTGQRGDGHAVVEARAVHVVRANPTPGNALERLMTHEGTHVLAYDAWGAAGTPLFGEGLAVWAAGAYGGVALDEWRRRVPQSAPSIVELLGLRFRKMPEHQAYPLAGLIVEAAIETLGRDSVRQHLYGATATTWESACEQAGTTPQALEAAYRAKLNGP